MATIQLATASNRPEVTDPNAVRALLEDYALGFGPHDEITAKVGGSDEEPVLVLYGYAEFGPVHIPTVEDDVHEDLDEPRHEVDPELVDQMVHDRAWDNAGAHTERFLRELSGFLTEPFVVQTVGHEKCRFPLVAEEWSVTPEGEITRTAFGQDR